MLVIEQGKEMEKDGVWIMEGGKMRDKVLGD